MSNIEIELVFVDSNSTKE